MVFEKSNIVDHGCRNTTSNCAILVVEVLLEMDLDIGLHGFMANLKRRGILNT